MKSYHADSGRGLASLLARDHPVPHPGPREALVRVHASSLNAWGFSVLKGTHPLPVNRDVVMCAYGAGEVAAVGPGVSRVAIAGRVSILRNKKGVREDRHQPTAAGAIPVMGVFNAKDHRIHARVPRWSVRRPAHLGYGILRPGGRRVCARAPFVRRRDADGETN